MASIQKIEGKKGISYKLVVDLGRDSDGKQIRKTKTWRPDPSIKKNAIENEALKAAFEFEQSIKQGYVVDDRQTFEQYAAYVLELKERTGLKHSTIESYKDLLKRINPSIGFMKLQDIRPQHLNRFYAELVTMRNENGKAKPKEDIRPLIKKTGMTQKGFAQLCGLSVKTIEAAGRGDIISEKNARKIAELLSVKPEKLFLILQDVSPLSNKTILEHHRCIHTILTQAEKEMLVPYNAADKATPPKVTKPEVNYFQPGQIVDILEALESEPLKWRVITHLLIVTGCRRGEIAGLKWKNVDFKNNKIRIDSTLLYSKDSGIYENATKTGDTRFLKLPSETMELLEKYKEYWEDLKKKNGDRWIDSGYVFTRDDGSAIFPDSITTWLARFSDRHGLPHINPHAFRHTQASILISKGLDVVTVSKRLGHSRVSTTEDIYSHLIAEADADASDCIADVILRKRA